MTKAVKEALCASCIHKDVCKFSDTYLELTDLINRSITNTLNSKVIANTVNSKVKDKYDFIEIQDPKCTYFRRY